MGDPVALPGDASRPPPRPLVPKTGPVGRFFAGALVSALGRLSPRGLRRLAAFVGGLAFALGIRRRVTLENLARALPELPEAERRRIARGAYRNMALAALESLTSLQHDEASVGSLVEVENWDAFAGAIAVGKGVLVATAHFGSWELLGEVMARRGIPISVVAKPLAGALNERIVRSRLESGVKLIHPRGAIQSSIEALARGEVVCMLVDQVIDAKRGVFVPFFGQLASTTPALSVAAIRSKAPVFVAMGAREGERLRCFMEGPLFLSGAADGADEKELVREHTAQITAAIERRIRQYPDQWMWLHRRWKVKPPDET